MSIEVSNWLVSWFITHLGDLQPTFIGVIIHLLSTMDIPVGILKLMEKVLVHSIYSRMVKFATWNAQKIIPSIGVQKECPFPVGENFQIPPCYTSLGGWSLTHLKIIPFEL